MAAALDFLEINSGGFREPVHRLIDSAIVLNEFQEVNQRRPKAAATRALAG